MTDFNGKLDQHFARLEADAERRAAQRESYGEAIDEAELAIVADAHHFDDATGEFDDLRRELCEALIEQHKASRSSDPEAIKEAAQGTVEVMDKIAAAYAPSIAEHEERAA